MNYTLFNLSPVLFSLTKEVCSVLMHLNHILEALSSNSI
jgi:hypothetical protein